MKKWIALLLCLMMMLCLTACDEQAQKELDEKVAQLQDTIKNGPQDAQEWLENALDVENNNLQ